MAKGSGSTRGNAPSANPQLKGAGNTAKQDGHPNIEGNWLDREKKSKAYLMTRGNMSNVEAQDVIDNVRVWSGNGFGMIRGWQLGRFNGEDLQRSANTLEDFIEKMPKWNGGTTYRGMEQSQKRAFFESLDVGDTWDAKSLNSWTSDYDTGKFFANEFGSKNSVLLRCTKPQNGTSVKYMSSSQREDEVLVSGRARYKCVGKSYQDDGTLVVDLEPISNGKVRR